ncbi:MAG TPA: ATP-binding protein [Candidatus Binatia bacterium]|nr:ATP-binding protein [Candidatus Binatia bacterium]
MQATVPFAAFDAAVDHKTGSFDAWFDRAPLAAARCNGQGMVIEMNAALRRQLHGPAAEKSLSCPIAGLELLRSQEREQVERQWSTLLAGEIEHFTFLASLNEGAEPTPWAGWRAGETGDVVLMNAGSGHDARNRDLCQAGRWEAIGRLTGGVVHDFNNLLTGIMLYCDLMLSSLDARDRRRRYAQEIRHAVIQASGLVRQLLVFARPQAVSIRPLDLNEIATEMRGLLTRLIGENIALDLNLEPGLSSVAMDPAQAQQVLLNLVLNARDALLQGGQSGKIAIETRNCRFQPVAGSSIDRTLPPLPCVMIAVTDNGTGMSAETRRRLFEPFFSTKNRGQSTGLGLTTVQSVVSASRGLIHFQSEAGRGTRAMILLPQAGCAPSSSLGTQPETPPASATPLHPLQEEPSL